MNLQYRIYLLSRLGEYILGNDAGWLETKEKASRENGWFTPEFIDIATKNISLSFLQKDILENWSIQENIPAENPSPKKVGLVMAGNIPLVGFHDWLCVFMSGHKAQVKLSSKDAILLKHLCDILIDWEPEVANYISFSEMLKGCDAYIATGSNNSGRYFDYYFGKYPNLIRRNRTSVAILSGNETQDELEKLADDIHLYFGLGCRNVTKLYVPENYDFIPLLEAFRRYIYFADHHKYKNNYDYNLAIYILNKQFYMTNGSILLIEDKSMFSPISQLNYEYYDSTDKLTEALKNHDSIQAISGKGFQPFGKNQCPAITDYADGVNTMEFLLTI